MPTKTIRVISASTGDRLSGRGVTLGYYGLCGGMDGPYYTNGYGEVTFDVDYGRQATVYVAGYNQGDIGGYSNWLFLVEL